MKLKSSCLQSLRTTIILNKASFMEAESRMGSKGKLEVLMDFLLKTPDEHIALTKEKLQAAYQAHSTLAQDQEISRTYRTLLQELTSYFAILQKYRKD